MMKIKKITMSIVLICVILMQAKSQIFTINGEFKNLPDGTKVYLRTDDKDTVAKAISTGDRFVLTGKLPLNGRFHFISFDTLVSKAFSKAIFVINRPITVSGTVGQREVVVKGSPDHLEYKNLIATGIVPKTKMDSLRKELVKFGMNYDKGGASNDRAHIDAIMNEIKKVNETKIQSGIRWINEHSSSLYAPYVIIGYSKILGVVGLEKAYERLSAAAKQSYYGQKLFPVIENLKLAKIVREGTIIPNFKITTTNGNAIYLQEIARKSKYTLYDFWASWCSPCRAEVPKLKALYAKYKDKGLNIIGVSSDKEKLNWEKALKEDGTSWIQGLQEGSNQISEYFGVKAIPAYILVDQNGKMIAFDCAMSNVKNFGGSLRGEGLEKKLEILLGN